jgi:CheY-like chemotaxis protein
MKNALTFILLADNNDKERLYLKDALENLRIKTFVQTVNNGEELLQYLTSPAAASPHILFIDQNVQGSAGDDYLHQLRNLDSTKDTSIAVYSANATDMDIERSFVGGANVYIRKPADFKVFRKKLENVLAMNLHYQSSGLNRDNFILSV